MNNFRHSSREIALVLSGGVGLAAYHAGVFEELRKSGMPRMISGSSAGAVTAALICGTIPDETLEVLRSFWAQCSSFKLGGWSGVMQSRLSGAPGFFTLRPPAENAIRFKSVYDLSPLRRTLDQVVDFGRLNSGPIRLCVAATDIRSGDPVMFDTSAGCTIGADHILASCGFLPEFAPIEIDGQLLGDGGLSYNAPFEPALASSDISTTIVADLFARDGNSPSSLAEAAERKNDLIFGNQTFLRLKAALSRSHQRCIYLSYRNEQEPGAEKPYDLSASAIARRWEAGGSDLSYGMALHAQSDDQLIVVRR
jgi:NTE family protein